uniref:AzlC family ABC transporter permease n=1 Tax=Salinigranum salinum TaxID=1364937 RepID=UPI00374423E2
MPTAAREGIRAALPLTVGLIPFGLVAGVAAVDAGLSPVAAVGMSVVVFAGAAQLAVVDLLRTDANLVVVVLTGVVVNLRILMYSASIAPYFQRYGSRWKAVLAYFLTDQAYALSIARYTTDPAETDGAGESTDSNGTDAPTGGDATDDPTKGTEAVPDGDGALETADARDRDWFFLGVSGCLWVVWVVTTAVGVGLGRGIPDAWGLDFAVPLVFLALLVPQLEDGSTLVAGAVAGVVALAGTGLPYHLGLPVAAVVGVGVALVVEGTRGR